MAFVANKIFEAGLSKKGNGTYRTRCLIWLQFGSVSAAKIFPAANVSAKKVKLKRISVFHGKDVNSDNLLNMKEG